MTDRGPKPASPLPWHALQFMVGDGCVIRARGERTGNLLHDDVSIGRPVARVEDSDDGRAILHRVNNWDALCDEVERLRETLRHLYGAGTDVYTMRYIKERHPELEEGEEE